MSEQTPVADTVPFPRKRVEVLDSHLSYLEAGTGPVVLFLHGNPTSSYLWRNVLGHLTDQARCIAPDLIGMGDSGKPDIEYRFVDHARYLDAFIEALGLTEMTLVVHDWGSALGFHYSHRHPERIRGLAFLEPVLAPIPDWAAFPAELRALFQRFRDPVEGRKMIIDENAFVEQMLPGAIVRPLTEAEHEEYRRPFRDPAHRTPVWRWTQEIPIAGEPADVHEIVAGYAQWLRHSPIPKLLLAGDPGALIPPPLAEQVARELPATELVHVGAGRHYLQEDSPAAIGSAIAAWHARLTG